MILLRGNVGCFHLFIYTSLNTRSNKIKKGTMKSLNDYFVHYSKPWLKSDWSPYGKKWINKSLAVRVWSPSESLNRRSYILYCSTKFSILNWSHVGVIQMISQKSKGISEYGVYVNKRAQPMERIEKEDNQNIYRNKTYLQSME